MGLACINSLAQLVVHLPISLYQEKAKDESRCPDGHGYLEGSHLVYQDPLCSFQLGKLHQGSGKFLSPLNVFPSLIMDSSLPPSNESWEENLTEEEISILIDDGILSPSLRPSYLRVSAVLLSWSISSTPTASVRRVGTIPDSNQTFDFPSHERSVQALDFYDHTTSAAMATYQRWHTRPDPRQNPHDLVDYTWSHTGTKILDEG